MSRKYSEFFKLKTMADTLREVELKENEHPLTDELLEALVKYYKRSVIFKQNIGYPQEKIDSYEYLLSAPFIDACGCRGPQGDDPYCGCTMRELQYLYRYDIALVLLEEEALEHRDVAQSE